MIETRKVSANAINQAVRRTILDSYRLGFALIKQDMRVAKIGSLVLLIAFLTSVGYLAVFTLEASRIFLNQHSAVQRFKEVNLATVAPVGLKAQQRCSGCFAS